MTSEIRAVFVIERDNNDVWVYPSLDLAAGSVEYIDVENGEFRFYTDDGTVLDANVIEKFRVTLSPTSTIDLQGLMSHLRRWISVTHIAVAPKEIDPVVIAQAISDARWEATWPRKPEWLRRRLNGDQPPEFQTR